MRKKEREKSAEVVYIILLVVDLITKSWWGNRGVSNTGFGLGINFNWLIYLSALVGIVILYFRNRNLGLGLVLTGGSANLIDRLINGKITDWIPIKLLGLWVNLADLYISLGVVIWLAQKFYTKTKT